MDMACRETHPTVQLPLELIELIIDEVANQRDKTTLRNFSLVSRSLVVRCQKNLFHTIDLGDKHISGEEYYHLLYRILHRHPKFCLYVEDLRLVDTYIWDQNKNWSWLVQEDSICDMLDLLPNLHSFSLSFNTGQPTWLSFNPCIRHSLMQLAKRPTMQSYSLSHIHDFPPPCLIALATTKQLTLHDVHADSTYLTHSFGIVLELVSLSTPCLETLVLKAPSAATVQVLQNILFLYPEPTLKTLRIGLMDEKNAELIAELWSLIQWASKSLTHLEWRSATRKNAVALRPPAPLDLSTLPYLHTLHFLVNFHSGDQPVFDELLSILDEISLGARLRELVIECMFVKAVELVACARDWSSLDATLSRPSFGNLKTLVFGGRMRTMPKSLKESARTILMEQLPVSRSKGMMIVLDMNLCG